MLSSGPSGDNRIQSQTAGDTGAPAYTPKNLYRSYHATARDRTRALKKTRRLFRNQMKLDVFRPSSLSQFIRFNSHQLSNSDCAAGET